MPLPTYTTSWEAVRAMQSAFNDYWSGLSVRSVVFYDNVGFDPNKTAQTVVSDDPDVSGLAWMRFTIQHADGQIAALGTRRFRQRGVATGQLFVENGRGRLRTVGKLGDNVLRFFQTRDVAGITWQNPRMNEIGESGRWWQVNILSDFVYDLLRS